MRVGTKLLLLVLLPTCGFFALASIAALNHWHSAERLRDFRDATRLSFASAGVAEALADERRAVTLRRLGERSADGLSTAEAEGAVDAALLRATRQAPQAHAPFDVAGRLGTARGQVDALRLKAAAESLVLQEIVEEYGVIVRGVSGIVRDLDSGRPSRATGRAADAYVAMVQAVEAAEMERVTQAAALVRGTEGVRVRGVIVEANALDTFREYAARPLVARLDRLLSEPSSATVENVREGMIRDPASIREQLSPGRWLAASGTRIDALRRLEHETASELDATATTGVDAAWSSARRVVAASLGLLIIMTGVGLVLRRSITRPLEEVSWAARKLSAGQLASGVSYAGADEIGEVAGAFRGLHRTAERLAEEIRAVNAAVDEDRLDHRADVAAFDGSWAELMAGVNGTMAAFAELQARREQAERHADRIFDMSLDMLCIAGFDGYFKRVNPAFARLLGYPMETMLSRPTREFVHPDDRATRDARHGAREKRHDVRYEQRQLCSDGSVRWVEWSARFVPEERRVYGVGRDVTESRRAAAEQAALRRVATHVAKGVAPAEIFAAVAGEVQALFEAASAAVARFEPDGSIAVMGSVPDGSGAMHENVAAAVADAAGPTRVDGAVGAPVVVEDRVWGVVAATEGAEPLPRGTEERLARFTDLVATAIANAESRAEVAASRARVIATGDEERRRLVRDLHDGGQQGLVHTVIALELASRAYEEGDEGAPALVAEALEHARRANDELRELSHGILPQSLRRGGLAEAAETLVARVPLPVATDVSVGRLPPVAEATAYFVLAEALTNVVKHAHAASADVSVDVRNGAVRVLVRDDGVGGAQANGRGLTGLRDRLEALHGRLVIDSPIGRGTVLAAEIPLSGHQADEAGRVPESEASSEV
jgi:PAS domain S-box-containing protein